MTEQIKTLSKLSQSLARWRSLHRIRLPWICRRAATLVDLRKRWPTTTISRHQRARLEQPGADRGQAN